MHQPVGDEEGEPVDTLLCSCRSCGQYSRECDSRNGIHQLPALVRTPDWIGRAAAYAGIDRQSLIDNADRGRMRFLSWLIKHGRMADHVTPTSETIHSIFT